MWQTCLSYHFFALGLETTATFDQTNQTIVIHTPTITGTKWWIGNAGYLATHAVQPIM